MRSIVECVPNFSEGRDAQKVESIVQAILNGPEVYLLDQEMDADHNRSVITFVGTVESVGEAALRGIGKATELIDLNRHQGGHPRIGATDVVPFVPIAGVTLDDCVHIAERVAEQAWRRFRVPTYLYESAARKPERRNLEDVRRGQFEGLRDEVRLNPDRRPDFGEASLHPTAGATAVGARKFLIAYNINLSTPDLGLAQSIAKKIRASSGGFACVKAMGVRLEARNLVQVSMNLTDFETTPMGVVFDAVAREAAARGVSVAGSQIVGLVPRRALESAAVHYLKVENFHLDMIFENRLERVGEAAGSSGDALAGATPGAAPSHPGEAGGDGARARGPLRNMAERFVVAVASATPTPGGGSVAALAGALAAALGEMVCGITLRRKSFTRHHRALEASLARLSKIRERLLENVDRDSQSYEAVVAVVRRSRGEKAELRQRSPGLEEASKKAASVPLETAELAWEVAREVEALRNITVSEAASDLVVASHLAQTALEGGMENVRANLPTISDREWVADIETKLQRLATRG